MTKDNIPPKDTDFNLFVTPFSAYINTNGATMGIKPATITEVSNLTSAWNITYGATTNPATVTSTAVAQKNEARAALEAVLRPLIRQIQADPATTDDMRTAMGLHIPSATRGHVPPPGTAPLFTVGTGQHLGHVIDFRDAATPNHRGKPAGAFACQIHYKVGGPAPVSLAELNLTVVATSSPQLINFDMAQAGQVVYYRLCWMNATSETGPWSDLLTATVPG